MQPNQGELFGKEGKDVYTVAIICSCWEATGAPSVGVSTGTWAVIRRGEVDLHGMRCKILTHHAQKPVGKF